MVKFLTGEKVYLRGLTKKDCAGRYLEMVNDASSMSFVEGIGKKPLTAASLEAYVESQNNSSNMLLGIFENNTNTHVGNIRLYSIIPIHNKADLGMILHRDYVGKGYAAEALKLLLKHAFETTNLNRIQSCIVDVHERAIKLYEKLGARKEGVLGEGFYYRNRYHDLYVYAFLRKDCINKLKTSKGQDQKFHA